MKQKQTMIIRENAVKVYKDTVWVWIGIIFFVAVLAFFIYLLFTGNYSIWGYVSFGVALILTSTYFFEIKKGRNTIVVYPDSLHIEHAQMINNDFLWENVGTVEIKWSQIKRISCEYLYKQYYYYVIIEPQKGKSYRFAAFEPTRLFLKRQLKEYHKQYK